MPYNTKIQRFRESHKMTHQEFADAVGVSRGAVLALLVWIGLSLQNIAATQYTGPSTWDDHGKAIAKIQQSIEEMHLTLRDIAKK